MDNYKQFSTNIANSMRKNELIIAVDFDGTLTCNDGTKSLKPNKTLCRQLRYIKEHSIIPTYIILWTCRCDTSEQHSLSEAVDWCERYNVPIDGVNESPTESEYERNGTYSRKLYADFYIDDHSVGSLDTVIGSLMRKELINCCQPLTLVKY